MYNEITISIDTNVIHFAWHLDDLELGLGGKQGKIIHKKTKPYAQTYKVTWRPSIPLGGGGSNYESNSPTWMAKIRQL